jgi:hypothetical protein
VSRRYRYFFQRIEASGPDALEVVDASGSQAIVFDDATDEAPFWRPDDGDKGISLYPEEKPVGQGETIMRQ